MSRGTRTVRARDAALVSLRACGLLRSPDSDEQETSPARL
jgi:hypothetical protein